MKQLFRTDRFKKEYKGLPEEIKGRADKTLELLPTHPRHPSLQTKKMEGAPDIWEARVSDNYRITFQFVQEGIVLRRIGTHNVLRKP